MDAFEELMKTLMDETASSSSRRNAISALGRLGDERAVELLVSALQDEDKYLRREAAKALGELGFPNAVEPLIESLEDPEDYVQRNSITALGMLGDQRAIEPLRKLLEARSFFTRSEAEKSLRKIQENLSESATAEEVTMESQTPSPPPAKEETAREVPPVQEDIVEEKPEVPSAVPEVIEPQTPMEEVSDEPVTTVNLSDDKKKELQEHHIQKAKNLAREIDQQREKEGSGLSDELGADSAKRKARTRLPRIILAIVVIFSFAVIRTGRVTAIVSIIPVIIILFFVFMLIRIMRRS